MEAHFLYLLLVLIVVINLCVFMSSQASSQLWLLTRSLWNQRWMRRKLQSSSSSRRFFAWVWLWATCRWRRSRSSKTSRWASTSWFHCWRRIGRTWVMHAFSPSFYFPCCIFCVHIKWIYDRATDPKLTWGCDLYFAGEVPVHQEHHGEAKQGVLSCCAHALLNPPLVRSGVCYGIYAYAVIYRTVLQILCLIWTRVALWSTSFTLHLSY